MEHEKETDMARANSTESPQSELDDLSAQIATLKQDVSNLTKSLGELGTASKEAAKNGARPSNSNHSSTAIGISRWPRLSMTSLSGVNWERGMPSSPLRMARRCTWNSTPR